VELALSIILIAVFFMAGLYRVRLRPSLLDDGVRLLAATSIGLMATLAFAFLYQRYAYSRAMFFFTWALIVVFLWGARLVRRLVGAYLLRHGIGLSRVLVVGGGNLGRRVMHVFGTEPGLGCRLVGFVGEDGCDDFGRFPALGTLRDVPRVVREHQVDQVVIALPSALHDQVPRIMNQCRRLDVRFCLVPDLHELSLSRVDIDELRGMPLIGVKEASIPGVNQFAKRTLDLAASSLLLLFTSPVWLAAAAAVKLDSPGPVLFRQTRVGRDGAPFEVLKFRSMHASAESDRVSLSDLNEASGPLFKIRDDPRMTRVGRLLRRASLDELPQLLNVLRGEMSMVGPRPPTPEEVEQYADWHRKRLEVAPGLTGLWQVSGRSDIPFDEMVMLDIYYIENWSLGLDLEILARTVPAVLSGRGAY